MPKCLVTLSDLAFLGKFGLDAVWTALDMFSCSWRRLESGSGTYLENKCCGTTPWHTLLPRPGRSHLPEVPDLTAQMQSQGTHSVLGTVLLSDANERQDRLEYVLAEDPLLHGRRCDLLKGLAGQIAAIPMCQERTYPTVYNFGGRCNIGAHRARTKRFIEVRTTAATRLSAPPMVILAGPTVQVKLLVQHRAVSNARRWATMR